MTYINNCFKQTEGICNSTLDYLRNFEVIQYPDGTALTFQQVSQMAATECDEIGGIYPCIKKMFKLIFSNIVMFMVASFGMILYIVCKLIEKSATTL